MGKMTKRRRRASKSKSKLAKLLKSLNPFKSRIPTPPPSKAFKSKKDYDRRDNKKAVDQESND